MATLLDTLGPFLRPTVVLLLAALGGWTLYFLLHVLWKRFARRRDNDLQARLGWPLRRPLCAFLPILAMQAALPVAGLAYDVQTTVERALGVGLIATGAWLAMGALESLTRFALDRRRKGMLNNLSVRRIRTQLTVLTRTARTVILVIAAGAILMTFPGVRQVGASMLASAGIAGIIVGIAAQPTLSNLIAGLQIAISQPLRLGDVVVFQKERGQVEEIGATFIVIRLLDDRRAIVPLRWFLENPFENWTRKSSELLGTVALRVDFDAPMDELRAELRRLCEASPDWDRRACDLKVTDSSESTLEIRATVSAADSDKLSSLRASLREGLIDYLRSQHPSTLPRLRAELGDYGHHHPGNGRLA